MKSLVFIGFLTAALTALAAPGGLFSGVTQQSIALDEALRAVRPGSVVIIGENHGFKTHQTQQIVTMETLSFLGLKVSVGLEFFSYPYQQAVEQWRLGQLPEDQFLKMIGWGSMDFSYYRDQASYPDLNSGSRTIALNAPSWLTSKVAKGGIASLTAEEVKFLPPNFQLGRASYRLRFEESIPHKIPPDVMAKYFEAQSIWDDTMAWQAQTFLAQHPDQVLVIIVGEFHVQYGGGLPDRLKARGLNSVFTISQVDTTDFQDSELPDILAPSPRDGIRADVLWLAPAEPSAQGRAPFCSTTF